MSLPTQNHFDKITNIIETARNNALQAVNTELIKMYWNVGEYLYELTSNSAYGDKIIDEIAEYIAQSNPTIKGFNRRGLYRMRQFYEAYKDDAIVSPLVTQLSWTNHLIILSGAKSAEERRFYIELAIRERYSKRELERQIDSAYYERYVLSQGKQLPEHISQTVRNSILDTYILDFLDLPEQYSERNFQKALIENLKNFLLELGKDFSFIGEEYKVQVGGQDYFIDLLFYQFVNLFVDLKLFVILYLMLT